MRGAFKEWTNSTCEQEAEINGRTRMIYSEMEAACIAWKQKWRCCWSLTEVSWLHLPQFSYSSSFLNGKIRHVLSHRLSVRRDGTLGDLSPVQKSVLNELETPLSEKKTKEEISLWALTTLKENKVGSQEPEEQRISLEALVCADTKASSFQVNLPSYHFQMTCEKSNIHKLEEQDLKRSQMRTQNLCC